VTTLIEMERGRSPSPAEKDTKCSSWTAGLYQLYKQDLKAYVLVLQNINRRALPPAAQGRRPHRAPDAPGRADHAPEHH